MVYIVLYIPKSDPCDTLIVSLQQYEHSMEDELSEKLICLKKHRKKLVKVSNVNEYSVEDHKKVLNMPIIRNYIPHRFGPIANIRLGQFPTV